MIYEPGARCTGGNVEACKLALGTLDCEGEAEGHRVSNGQVPEL